MPRGENFYKVTIESGGSDPSKFQSRVFIIDEEDDELLWILLRRIRVRDQMWAIQQNRRQQAEERRLREEQERMREANERIRQAQETFRNFGATFDGGSYNFFFDHGAGPQFRGRDDGQRSQRRSEPKTSKPRTSWSNSKSFREQLADLAGVEHEETRDWEIKKLLKRAQRNCHPDTGGSHEKWIELEKLTEKMGI